MQDHTKLRVWQRAHALDVYVHQATHLMRDRDSGSLRSQLRRAVASIPANLAEGAGQESSAQFARFIQVAIASNNEALNHLAKTRALALIPMHHCNHVHEELQAIRAMSLLLHNRVQPT